MPIALPWYWKIQALGQGPDYYFDATFAPEAAARLATLVHQQLPPGFVHHPGQRRRCPCAYYAQYLDAHTDSTLQAIHRGEDVRVWGNAKIEVCDHELFIAHSLSGWDYGDTSLIYAIARSPELILQRWRVHYGGDGYTGGEVAHGDSDASLRAYLNRECSG